MDFMEWDVLTLTKVLTKLFIPQTLLSTQIEIAMNSLNTIAQLLET